MDKQEHDPVQYIEDLKFRIANIDGLIAKQVTNPSAQHKLAKSKKEYLDELEKLTGSETIH